MGEVVSYGWLRPEVEIARSDTADSIRFAHWEVRVPRGALSAHELRSVLSRDRPVACDSEDEHLVGLLALLDAQGCFRRFSAPEECSMREFRRRFDRLRSSWYATYYAHPLWNRLRHGEASRNELLAWVMHNYHISRVAGATAARCASRPYGPEVCERFLEDTLDEYWHVNSYYFIRHPGLAIRDEDVKAYVPLAGSRAFELHALQVADRNPLGHLLIAYFQEATAVFLEDCESFYLDVERAYGLPNFFDGWLAHMRLDIDQRHASGLSELLENDRLVSPGDQLAAIRCAYLAYRYLLGSLDQVMEQARPDDLLDVRAPHDYALGGVPAESKPNTPNAEALINELLSSGLRATLSCLGRTLDHDDLMHLGRLCRSFRSARANILVERNSSIWSEALGHLLQEQAIEPSSLASVLHRLELRCREHGQSYLPRDAFQTVSEILTRQSGASSISQSRAITARMAEEFIDLAFQSPVVDTEVYSP